MAIDPRPGIAVVTRPTRLQGFLGRWSTTGAARFALVAGHRVHARNQTETILREVEARAEAEFDDLQQEDVDYAETLRVLKQQLDFGLPIQFVDRKYLANFDFGRFEVVVVVGQDGLVANVAKYVGSVPIVAVNPDPRRFDGVLLPFAIEQARSAVDLVLKQRFRERTVTLACATREDGQTLLAFNDLFVGAASHVSARYTLRIESRREAQSSSGMIISTGAGSTGWLSSVFNMACGLAQTLGASPPQRPDLSWEDRSLLWAVREPFTSRTSQASLVFGRIDLGSELEIESNMSEGGVIFSDGVESDFLEFNNGAIVKIGVANQQARLVIP